MISETEQIENLDLSARAINVLRRHNVYRVSDLISADLKKIRYSGGVGEKTFSEIATFVDKILNPKFDDNNPVPFEPVSGVIDRFLGKLKHRNREICLRRMGLLNGREETLESIGVAFNLTRERVRQIENKLRSKLTKLIRIESKGILDVLLSELRRQTVLSVEDLSEIYQSASEEDSRFSRNAVITLTMEAIGEEAIFIKSSANLWTVSQKLAMHYPDIIRMARATLSGLTMDLQTVSVDVAREVGFREKVEIEVVKKILCASTQFLNIVNIQGFNSNAISPKSQTISSMRKDFAYFYIKGQGVPINVREIFRAMQGEAPDLVPRDAGFSDVIHVTDASLERDKRLAWAGNSMYALVEWGYEHEVRSIDKAIERLLRRVGRPMTSEEISNEILKLYLVSRSSILAALNREEGKRFRRIRRGMWTLS